MPCYKFNHMVALALITSCWVVTRADAHACAEEAQYGIVMDAGSSGTRIRLYCWLPYDAATQVPDIYETFNKKAEPGLSSYWGNTDDLDEYFLSLLDESKLHVPEEKQSETPIYVMATAGLRLVGEENANKIFDKVNEIMMNDEMNPYHFEEGNARILSGEEEGLFSWLTVNYLLNNFQEDDTEDKVYNGVVEMGGASAQIAFNPEEQILAHKFSFLLGGTLRSVYVYSYLGYGQDQALVHLQDNLIQNATDSGVVDDPCRQKEDIETVIRDGQNYTLSGTGEPDRCVQVLEQVLFNPIYRERCSPEPCAIGGTYQPSVDPDHPFYAVSAFKYALAALDVLDEDDMFTVLRLRERAFEFCRQAAEPEQVNNGNPSTCTTGLYFSLFLERLGFHMTDARLYSDINGINGQDAEWPEGALLYQLSQVVITDDDSLGPPRPTSANAPTIHATWITLLLLLAAHGSFIE